MSCTCGCEHQELDEGASWWNTLGAIVLGLFIADMYAHPFGGRPTRAQRERLDRIRRDLQARIDRE